MARIGQPNFQFRMSLFLHPHAPTPTPLTPTLSHVPRLWGLDYCDGRGKLRLPLNPPQIAALRWSRRLILVLTSRSRILRRLAGRFGDSSTARPELFWWCCTLHATGRTPLDSKIRVGFERRLCELVNHRRERLSRMRRTCRMRTIRLDFC